MDGGAINDYNAPVVHSKWNKFDEDFHNIWRGIINILPKYDLISFIKQPKKIGNINNPFISYFSSITHENAYGIKLNTSWDNFENNILNKKIRQDSKRQLRRLESLGKVQFIVASTDKEKKTVISKMIDQKIKKNNMNNEWSILSKKGLNSFYKNLPNYFQNKKFIHCSYLKINDTIIATHVGILHNDEFYYLMPGYDLESWGKFSPGRLLLKFLVEWSYENKIKYFDFTYGDEKYKTIWSNNFFHLYAYNKSSTLKGLIYLFLIMVFEILKKNQKLKNFIKPLYNFYRNIS